MIEKTKLSGAMGLTSDGCPSLQASPDLGAAVCCREWWRIHLEGQDMCDMREQRPCHPVITERPLSVHSMFLGF